jgi:hypothetical protein
VRPASQHSSCSLLLRSRDSVPGVSELPELLRGLTIIEHERFVISSVARCLVARDGSLCSRQRMGFKPERAGSCKRIYSRLLPPQSFIAATMDLPVVRATKRHREFVAHFATERTSLREP